LQAKRACVLLDLKVNAKSPENTKEHIMARTTDPVCKMDLDSDTAEFQSTFAGKKFYFCSEDCQEEFDDRPADYASATAAA
jgi:YHS domain-containing protein